MTRLLRAELSKLLTLRVTYLALVITAVASAGLTALITNTLATDNSNLAMRRGALTIAGTEFAPGIALLLGMLIIGSEFRHNTITPALLITPLRGRLLLAKMAVAAAAGVVFAAVATVTALGSAAVTLSSSGSAQLLDTTEIAGIVGTAVLLSVLYGIVGVGVGTLIRNPTTALIVAMSGLYIVDPLLSLAVPGWALPGGAGEVIGLSSVEPLDISLWLAVGVLASYAAAITAGALRLALPRDLT